MAKFMGGKLKQVIVYRVIQSLSIVEGSKFNFFIYIKKKEYTNHWINIEIKNRWKIKDSRASARCAGWALGLLAAS